MTPKQFPSLCVYMSTLRIKDCYALAFNLTWACLSKNLIAVNELQKFPSEVEVLEMFCRYISAVSKKEYTVSNDVHNNM